MEDDFKMVFPRKYYKKFFNENVRPDNRSLEECRPVHLEVGGLGTADGSSLVTIGNTKIICGVVSAVSEVKSGESVTDSMKISVEFPHVNTQQMKVNQLPEPSQLANNLMETIFKNSECLKPEDLIFCDGKMQRTITCELVCLDYDGCLYDACCLALNAALANTDLKIYDKIENGSEVFEEQISYQPTKESKKLSLINKFFATTFALWNSKVILFDPTKEEEDLSKGTITIVCSANSDEYFIQKPGGCELTDEQLNFCLKHSKKKTEVFLDIFNQKFHSTDEQ